MHVENRAISFGAHSSTNETKINDEVHNGCDQVAKLDDMKPPPWLENE